MTTPIEEDFDIEVYDLAEKALLAIGIAHWNGRSISKKELDFLTPLAQRICDLVQPSEDQKTKDYTFEQLAILGTSTDQFSQNLLDRDIEELHTQEARVYGKNWFVKVGHKSTKFWKKHKTAIIVGALVIAVVVTAAVVITATSGTAAAAGGSAATGIAKLAKNQKDEKSPPKNTKALDPLAAMTQYGGSLDEDAVLRAMAIAEAEKIAKEQRYPNLVHSETKIEEAQQKYDEAQSRVTDSVQNLITAKDIGNVATLALDGLSSVAAAKKGNPTEILITGAHAGLVINDLINDKLIDGNKLIEASNLAAEAKNHLKMLEDQNRQASFDLCEKKGYKPKLEFNQDLGLTDKNNPASNHISVKIP